jgi:hypothetical protein
MIAIPHIPKLLGVPGNLDKDRDNSHWVGCRAGSVVVGLGRVGHMGLVVRAIQVDTVPARGEIDLRTDSIGTVGGWEVGCLRGARGIVVQAGKVASLSFDGDLVAAIERVSSDHTEASRRGNNSAIGGWVWALSLLSY